MGLKLPLSVDVPAATAGARGPRQPPWTAPLPPPSPAADSRAIDSSAAYRAFSSALPLQPQLIPTFALRADVRFQLLRLTATGARTAARGGLIQEK